MPDPRHDCVLVVDDDADIRETLRTLFAAHQVPTRTARDGAEALALLRQGIRPCLILLDLMMPGMNGQEFRAAQLGDPELAEIPVIIITGAGGQPAGSRELAGLAVMRKPIGLPVLLGQVRRHCRQNELRNQEP